MRNTFEFTLPTFPNDRFEFETNLLLRKTILKQNGVIIKQSKKKGKPFLLKRINEETAQAFLHINLPDISTKVLSIDGKKYILANKLKWYEYLVGALPFGFIFNEEIITVIIASIIGGVSTIINYSFFREKNSIVNKSIKISVVILLSAITNSFIINFMYNLLK